jgi:hypothetical protein
MQAVKSSAPEVASGPAPDAPRGLAAFRAYLAERFPVPVTLMLAVATAAASYAAAQARTLAAGAPLVIDVAFLGGIALVFLFLFHLRVFDEHKDFAHDSATRPDRPVQRGLVTLNQLKIWGAITLALEAVIALEPGIRAGWWWAIPVGYSVLMAFEFFMKDWLERHFALYAITHSAVMSLCAIAVAARFTERYSPGFPLEVLGVIIMALASFFSVDVLRKTWAPESEIAGVDSWSRLIGIPKAAFLGSLLLVITGLAGAWVGLRLGAGYGWIATSAVVTLWSVWQIRAFAVSPTVKREKMLQVIAGVHLLVMWVGVAVVAGIAHGVEWMR